ncbi:MAG: septal ring lytic transglycosylase RlpA family protein [Rhizobiales bacterium]|nr:septal ring lytic transglycosylase RlpA family protein [Hyphomicrobiales bacterium]
MRRQGIFLVVMGLVALGLVGCASDKKKLDPFAGKGSAYYKGKGPLPEGGGRYFVGKPYQVAGRWYTPKEQPGYDKVGEASWYGEAFHARRTSNGEYFDMNDYTAAHPTLPLPSYAKVTNVNNGRTIVVRINDRGPFVGTRLIDLSKRSADALGYRNRGKARVRVQWIANAPLNDKGYRHLAMMNESMKDGASIRQLASLSDRKAPATTMVASAEPPPRRQAAPQDFAEQYQEPQTTTVAYQPPPPPPPQPQDDGSAFAGFVVHVATFANRDNADAAYEELSASLDLQMFRFEGQDGPLYRIQTRPVDDENTATRMLFQLQDQGYSGAKIRRVRVQQVAYRTAIR